MSVQKLTLTVEVAVDVSDEGRDWLVQAVIDTKQGQPTTEAVSLAAAKLHGDVPEDFLLQTVLGETLAYIIHDSITLHFAPPPNLVEFKKCIVQYVETPDKLAPPNDAVPVIIKVGGKPEQH